MSRRNGDRARFQKERKRKMLRRQRVQEFIKAGRAEAVKVPDAPDYVKDIKPIFERSCVKCHGPEKRKSGLRLDKKRFDPPDERRTPPTRR
jgi:mono/diheme cytochrome c family protein